jgi:hypothetical protein
MSLSEAEYNLVLRFDEPELNQSLVDNNELSPHQISQRLSDAQLERIEACEKFFPNTPPKNKNRRTAYTIRALRDMVRDILTRYSVLKSGDMEKVTLKLELANRIIRERYGE